MKKVYIVHGWTYNLDRWAELVDYLRQKGVEAVQLKVPGLTEPSDKVWDIDGYIAWLDGQLKNEEHPVVIGHSNGGRISLAYTQKYPDKFSQLILIDSAGVPHPQLLRRIKLFILRIISKLGKPLAKVPLVKRVFYKVIGAQDYMNARPNMKVTMQNMLHADKTIDVSKATMPVTIIWGKDDTITPVSDARYLEKHIPNAKLHLIEGAKHAPMGSHVAQVGDIIVAALSGGEV